ncbi:hypothetical protein ACOMHN_012494 [Nucella lapillus]
MHTVMLTARRGGGCAVAYVSACDRCLKAGETPASYTDARQNCTETQGRLASAKSSAELSCLQSFGPYDDNFRVWLGADDIQSPGVFMWNDGTDLPDNSLLWDSLEPDKTSPGNDCVYFYPGLIGLYDRGCWYSYYYLCEYDPM